MDERPGNVLHYAALDQSGNVLGVERDAGAATELALELVPGATVSVQTLEHERTPNPVDPLEMPGIALRNCRLPRVPSSAQRMSLEDAHAALYPFFEGLIKRGERTRLYDTPLGMRDAWIGQNYKTEKDDPRQQAIVMGVTLVPAAHPRLAATGEGPYRHLLAPERLTEGKHMIDRWASELPFGQADRKFTLCTGSNQNCRDSCLVFCGQNASELYNTYRKVAQTMALLNEPAAFLRLLVESIEAFVSSRKVRGGVHPYLRLNVLSDVPWELVCPWLFERFRDLQFYDYTKVPGRAVPGNYDITFSFSGTNFDWAHSEVHERGRRIAVVFVGHKRRGDRWVPVKLKGPRLLSGVPLPHTFWGLPVVDGDISDVRPLDPAPACVGLRWKTPSGKRSGIEDTLGNAQAFVTPVYVIDEDSLSRLAVPRGNPDDRGAQWLVAPVTPRYQPIEHEIAQPEGAW